MTEYILNTYKRVTYAFIMYTSISYVIAASSYIISTEASSMGKHSQAMHLDTGEAASTQISLYKSLPVTSLQTGKTA